MIKTKTNNSFKKTRNIWLFIALFWFFILPFAHSQTVSFTNTPTTVYVGTQVEFTNTSSGFAPGTVYLWRFHSCYLTSHPAYFKSCTDTTTGTGTKVTKYASDVNIYKVTLIACNPLNLVPIDSVSREITITPKSDTPCNSALSCELVCNGSIETVEIGSSYPDGAGYVGNSDKWFNTHVNVSPSYNNTSPDWFHRYCTVPYGQPSIYDPRVPQNFAGYQQPRPSSQNGYAGLVTYVQSLTNNPVVANPSDPGYNYREYMEQKLTLPLKQNQKYIVGMYVSLSDSSRVATNGLGIYFSANKIVQPSSTVLNYTPQFKILTPITNITNWTLVKDTIMGGNQNYMTIGNFDSDLNTTLVDANPGRLMDKKFISLYYIDSIFVKPYHPKIDTTISICLGQCVTLESSVIVTVAFSYHWNSGEITREITKCPIADTIYTCTTTDIYNCTVIDTFRIKVNPIPDKTLLSGQWNTCHVINGIVTTSDTILNWNPAYSYDYFIGANGIHTPITSTPFNVNWTGHENGGMLYVEVTDTTTGCTNIDSLKVFDCCEKIGSPMLTDVTLTTPNATYNGEWFINGLVVINANTTFGGTLPCIINMGPNAKIIVNPGKTLTINQSSLLSSVCDIMWDGIYLYGTTSQLIIRDNSTIKDAKNAVVSTNGGNYQISNTVTMENNYRNIIVNSFSGIHPGKISKTAIKCTATLKPQYPLVAASRTYSGVEINSVTKIFIGDTTAYSNRNTFENMEFGVRSLNSNIFVYNNKFTTINAPSTYPNPPVPPLGTAVGILGGRNNSTNATIGGANRSGYIRSNYFYNCFYGIHFSSFLNTIKAEYDTMVMQTNSFTSPRGIYAYAGAINNATFRYNKVTNGVFGIQYIDMGENTSINISSNYIEKANNGIAVTNAASALPYFFQIANNTVSYPIAYTTAVIGIQVTNINGGKLGSRPYAFISTNSVTFAGPSSIYTAYGIRVQNCPKTRIEQNTVTNTSTTVPTDSTNAKRFNGIQVELSYSAYLCSNNVTKLGCGLRFIGSMPGSQVNVNTMNNTFYGVRLDGANIGNQGDTTSANGNIWLGTQNKRLQGTWSPIKWWYYGASGSSTSLYPLATYVSTTPPPPQNWVKLATGCKTTCPTIAPQMLMATVQDIVTEKYAYTTNIAENKYTDNVTAYTILKTEPALLSSSGQGNSHIQSFYNTNNAGNIGKFNKVNGFIHSGNINAAKVHNKKINPSNTIEINKQKVNDVYLNTWADDKFTFTDDEYSVLYAVATQEPVLGGDAVYSARVMIGEFDVVSNLKTTNPAVTPSAENIAGLIYPNPVSDVASIDYSIKTASDAILYVYSITGNQIAKYELNTKDNHFSFNTAQYNAGIYFYQLIANGELISYNKFIIIK